MTKREFERNIRKETYQLSYGYLHVGLAACKTIEVKDKEVKELAQGVYDYMRNFVEDTYGI